MILIEKQMLVTSNYVLWQPLVWLVNNFEKNSI